MDSPHEPHATHTKSEPHEHHASREPWIDRWWPVLLLLFGLTFTLCLALYRPQHEWSKLQPAHVPLVATLAVSSV